MFSWRGLLFKGKSRIKSIVSLPIITIEPIYYKPIMSKSTVSVADYEYEIFLAAAIRAILLQ